MTFSDQFDEVVFLKTKINITPNKHLKFDIPFFLCFKIIETLIFIDKSIFAHFGNSLPAKQIRLLILKITKNIKTKIKLQITSDNFICSLLLNNVTIKN